MYTHKYKFLPHLDQRTFENQMLEKGISLKEMPFKRWFDCRFGHERDLCMPVAIERRSFSDSPVVLYAVIYRAGYSRRVYVRHAWGKLKPCVPCVLYWEVGESE